MKKHKLIPYKDLPQWGKDLADLRARASKTVRSSKFPLGYKIILKKETKR